MNRIETNTATSARFIDSSVEADFPGADERRLERRLAQLDVARDVLEHDDRVVDDQAGGDDQRHQRQVVEREAPQVHHREAADERDRHGGDRDDRGAEAGQEQQHDEDDERHGDEQRALAPRAASRGCPASGRWRRARSTPAGRNARSAGSCAVDGVHRLDDVGVGLAADDQQHRRLVVEEAGVEAVLDAVVDVGDVRQAHRRAVAVARRSSGWYSAARRQLVAGLDLPGALRRPRPMPFGPQQVGAR